MDGKHIKDTTGESRRSGSTPMASAASSMQPVSRKLFSPASLRRPSVNISSSSAQASLNHTPNYYVRRREKVGDFASSCSRSEKGERERELKLSDPVRKSKTMPEPMSSEKKHDAIDYYLLKESSKLQPIAISERLIVKPLKISASRSGDAFEKKSVVSDRPGFQPKPVKKRIISEIMNETSATQKGNPPPVNSGRSSEKPKGHSSPPPKAKSDKMIVRDGTKTKSGNEVVSGGNLNPFTAVDFAPKTWSLRPRKPPVSNNGKGVEGSMADEKPGEAQKREKAKKTGFSISLSKEEIEADFLAMTGSKPPKKCQKRGRTAQKQVDVIISMNTSSEII